jgi:hypothetical protein
VQFAEEPVRPKRKQQQTSQAAFRWPGEEETVSEDDLLWAWAAGQGLSANQAKKLKKGAL